MCTVVHLFWCDILTLLDDKAFAFPLPACLGHVEFSIPKRVLGHWHYDGLGLCLPFIYLLSMRLTVKLWRAFCVGRLPLIINGGQTVPEILL